MEKAEIIEFANQHPVSWVATVEGDKPHVRGMMMWFADDTGFYYHTGTMKSLPHQLEKNPNVEIAFYDPGTGPQDGKMMRVAGVAEIVEDEGLKKRLLEERPWVGEIHKQFPDSKGVIFKVNHAQAYIWTMAMNGREGDLERVTIGAE
ncbi:MAG: pyridoxamine 5'-phosphate oxidase [Chitinivibrionales bacterium]|nr:pyridoxamine 5'-phosphate oxidase [Chitinivibrionales bacterium]MBD3356216.1 pyridoxamine 5'-phosphate oxidase [Chitinivibrionales bacterium]